MMTRHDYYENWLAAQAQKDRLEEAGLSVSSALEALIADLEAKLALDRAKEV